MNTHIDVEERLEMDSLVQMAGSEIDMLVRCGFSREEIAALLWLRQWYQTGLFPILSVSACFQLVSSRSGSRRRAAPSRLFFPVLCSWAQPERDMRWLHGLLHDRD